VRVGKVPAQQSRGADHGRDEARDRKVAYIVRNLDGTIGVRNTYGHDPRDIPS
jgi:hypothetical protein